MLGLFLIFFIGKWFYKLALDYNKNEWGYAVLGVISFYAGCFIGGILIAIIVSLTHVSILNTISRIVLEFLLLPFGFIGCWVFHKQLVLQWNKHPSVKAAHSLDGNLMR
jgi:hypothetical protein